MKRKKSLYTIILVLSIAVLVACAVYFIKDYLHYKSITDIGNTKNIESTAQEVIVPVDFDSLKATNEDIYAWIKIPGISTIDYPILQGGEDKNKDYYLKNNVNGQASVYGSIYTENYNSTDFLDFNTIIYGHNMRNGTMFGSLKKYRDADFFKENNEIIIYQPNRILKYRIFASYFFDDRHILMSFDFSDEDKQQEYLDMVLSNKKASSNFDESIKVTSKDNIITLSTCTSNDEERYLVQAVLVEDTAAKE